MTEITGQTAAQLHQRMNVIKHREYRGNFTPCKMEAGEVTKQTIVNVEEGVYFVTFLENNVHSKMHVHHPSWTGSLKSGTKLPTYNFQEYLGDGGQRDLGIHD